MPALNTDRQALFPGRRSRELLSPFIRAWMNSSTLTFRTPGTNHIVPTPFEAIAKALLYWNSRILLFRISSEMIVHRHWERFENHSLSFMVTKLECTRQHEASSNLRAAQILRRRPLEPNLQSQSFSRSYGSILPTPGYAADLGDLGTISCASVPVFRFEKCSWKRAGQ